MVWFLRLVPVALLGAGVMLAAFQSEEHGTTEFTRLVTLMKAAAGADRPSPDVPDVVQQTRTAQAPVVVAQATVHRTPQSVTRAHSDAPQSL